MSLLGRGCAGSEIRMATYNLRHFGAERKDDREFSRILAELDADILAVQEVRDPRRLEDLARDMSGLRRTYRAISSECAGRRQMHVSFLYDTRRVTLKKTREFRELLPEEGGCGEGDRPGLLGVFDAAGEELHALVVHLKSGGGDEELRQRRRQIERLQKLIGVLEVDGARRVVLLGDMNTTGYLDNDRGERDLVDGVAREAGLSVATAGLRCTEYYRKDRRNVAPSLLDHVLISSPALVPSSVEVHAHCRELQCAPRPLDAMPPSYTGVSDHCPVSFRIAR